MLMVGCGVLQTTHGCGDLVFSSHVTFTLVGCLTYNEYGSTWLMKVRPPFHWAGAAFVLLLGWQY